MPAARIWTRGPPFSRRFAGRMLLAAKVLYARDRRSISYSAESTGSVDPLSRKHIRYMSISCRPPVLNTGYPAHDVCHHCRLALLSNSFTPPLIKE